MRQAQIGGTPNDPDEEKTSDQDLPGDLNGTAKTQGSVRGNMGKMARNQREVNSVRTYLTIDRLLLKPLQRERQFEFCGYTLNISLHFGRNLGFSASIWEAALVLCQYFEREKIDFSGKKVIELGSGTGIVGILAALLGGEVTLTDKEDVLGQIEFNISLNIPSDCSHRAKVYALNWGKDHVNFPTSYDFILGSDIVYTSLTYPLLLKTLLHFSKGTAIIYLSTKLREGNHSAYFHEELLPQYFNCQLVHRVEDKRINVYKLSILSSTVSDDVSA